MEPLCQCVMFQNMLFENLPDYVTHKPPQQRYGLAIDVQAVLSERALTFCSLCSFFKGQSILFGKQLKIAGLHVMQSVSSSMPKEESITFLLICQTSSSSTEQPQSPYLPYITFELNWVVLVLDKYYLLKNSITKIC